MDDSVEGHHDACIGPTNTYTTTHGALPMKASPSTTTMVTDIAQVQVAVYHALIYTASGCSCYVRREKSLQDAGGFILFQFTVGHLTADQLIVWYERSGNGKKKCKEGDCFLGSICISNQKQRYHSSHIGTQLTVITL